MRTRRATTSTSLRRWVAALAVALTCAATSACNPGNPDVDSRAATQGLPNVLVNLTARRWVLDHAATGRDVGDRPITLDFHLDRTASGTAPCNAYTATFALGVDLTPSELGTATVTIADVVTTLRSCEPALMADEQAYLRELTGLRHVDLSDRDQLVLTGPSGERLVYDAVDLT